MEEGKINIYYKCYGSFSLQNLNTELLTTSYHVVPYAISKWERPAEGKPYEILCSCIMDTLSFLIHKLKFTGKLFFILELGSVRVAVYLVLCPILLTADFKYSSHLDLLKRGKKNHLKTHYCII